MDSNQDNKLNDAEVEVATSSSCHQQQNQGISDKDFREILSSMSEWYDRHGYINMLKVLYRDLVIEPEKLYAATKVIELFELLCTAGHLSSEDLTVLYDTINVTQPFGLEPEIRKLTTLLNIRTVSISTITSNRQMLIKVVVSLSDNDVKKISQLYNCPDMADRWELFVDLEHRKEFCEENMDDFMRKITTYLIRYLILIRDSHKEPLGLSMTGDMDIAAREASSPSTSKDDQGELIVTGDTDVATREVGLSASTDNVCMVNNMVIQGNQGSIIGSQFMHCNFGSANIVTNITAVPKTQGNQNDAEYVASSSNQEQLRDLIIKDYLTAYQKQMYVDVNRMTPATWNKEYEIDIAQVFTELDLLKSKREDRGARFKPTSRGKNAKPTTLAEVLDIIKSIDSCKVLIIGKGGMGKTTLLRYIAHNWATDVDNTFAGKILFLINIRNIKAGKNILHAIMQQIKLEDFNLKTGIPEDLRIIKQFINKHDEKIVLLLDGLDELEPGAESPISLFKRHELKKSTVILTSRPENTTDFDKICDVHVAVKGFSCSSIKQYIHKHFKLIRKYELGASLIHEFRLNDRFSFGGEHKEAFQLCSSPFLLLRICTMWNYRQYLPKDLSELLKEVTCCILNQYINRSGKGKVISHFDRIPKNYESAILALGKCMYKGLQMNKLSIDKYVLRGEGGNIEDEETVNLALQVGFVYQDEPTCEDDFREIYTPPHKLISEFLAGLYLCKQSQQGSLKSDECEMIRSNEYLHMTRVFTIGFLGADAGKLLKHWFINRASNYYSLAKYFKYVKKEHEEPVLQELDKHMSTEMKAHCEQICESFRNVLCIDGSYDQRAIVSKDVYLIQLMSQCYVKYERNPKDLEEKILSMIKKSTELSTEDVCAMLVHILIIVEGLYADNDHDNYLMNSTLQYLANWKAKEIDILSATMEKLKFKYSLKKFYFLFTIIIMEKLSLKFLIHLLKTACELRSLMVSYEDDCTHGSSVTGVVLNQAFIELHENQVSLKLRKLDVSSVNVISLANLLKIAPNLEELYASYCNLSSTSVNTMVTECQTHQLVLELNRLNLSNNHFSDIDAASFTNLFKIAPKLKALNMSKCNLSSTIVNTVVTECQSHQLVLDLNYLDISHNPLRDSDGVSFANLFKVAPKLDYLDISFCDLATTFASDFLNECDKIGVVLKDNMLALKSNDLSDIGGITLVNLVRIIGVGDWSGSNRPNSFCFKWSDYCLSADNLQGLIDACGVHGRLTWKKLDLSGINLASINEITLACLFKISPQLRCLDMSKCNMSGTSMRNVLNECNRTGVVLKDTMLIMKGNDLSDIDGASFAKLVSLLFRYSFKWSDYCLSVDNLQCLVSSIGEDGIPFIWELHEIDFSSINLSQITLAMLLSFFTSTTLRKLIMRDCSLCSSVLHDLVSDSCFRLAWRYYDKLDPWSYGYMLDLSNNDLAAFSGHSLISLLRYSPRLQVLNMSNCHLQSNVLHEVVRKSDENLLFFGITDLVLRDNDFSSLSGTTFASLPRCFPDLQRFDMSQCSLSGSIMEDLSRVYIVFYIRTSNFKALIDINLSGNDFSVLNKTMITGFSRFVPKLQDLIMNKCNLSCSIVQHLSETNIMITLTSISLGENDLSGLNWSSVASHISQTIKLKSINIHNCHLSSSILNEIANDFSNRNVVLKLNTIDLSNNDLSNLDGASIVPLVRAVPVLDDLNMSNCNLKGKDVHALVKAFSDVKSCHQLCYLYLRNNNFSDIDDGAYLASLCNFFQFLFNLDLSSCHLNDDILLNMADSLQVERLRLFKLQISDNNIVDKFRIERRLKAITSQLTID